jgi:hypothetical protein
MRLSGPRMCLDAVEKRIILFLPGIEPPAVQPVAHHNTDLPIPTHKLCRLMRKSTL